MKLVTLCSGGLDSVVLAHHLAARENEQVLLFVHYGQKHVKEHFSAMKCADDLGVPLKNVAITGQVIFKCALTLPEIPIDTAEATIVPNRNSIMANLAAALVVSLDYDGIAMAMHSGDREVYPDCTPKFVLALEYLLSVATEREQRRLNVVAPFLHKPKAEIVALGATLGVPFEKTWSCYEGGELHCGVCPACQGRKAAFRDAGVEDPTKYKEARYSVDGTLIERKKTWVEA